LYHNANVVGNARGTLRDVEIDVEIEKRVK